MLLQIIDERWREHLHDMDYLREGIHLRGFAQIEPLVAYKNEGFDMFTELMNNIWEEFARYIFNVEVEVEGQNGGGQWPAGGGRATRPGALNYAGGTAADQPSALQAAAATVPGGAVPAGIAEAAEYASGATAEPPPQVETRRVADEEKIGRNDPCWCGSGKKFKKCHGA
jgi:preprotein translocase subunit SecA